MDDFRAASLQSWATVAPDWAALIGQVDRQLERAAAWMIEAASPKRGERVLELAGGPGTVSLMAARAVGDEGRVVCTDFAEPMTAVARRRMESEGATNVGCRVVDAESIDFEDGSFDLVLCRMGYMLMADPAVALRETARVLAPGGRVALAVWAEATVNPWASVPMQAILRHIDAPPPPSDGPGLWALSDPERLRGMLERAGLRTARLETLDDTVEWDSVAAWIETVTRLAGPLRALFGGLDDEARNAIMASVEEAAAPYKRAQGGLSVPERMLVAVGERS